MQNRNLQKSILPDYHDKLAETFEQITDYLDNNQLGLASKLLATLHYADLADYLDNTAYKNYKIILYLLKDKIKPETLIWLSGSSKPLVIEALGIQKSILLINELAIEDAIEVIEDLNDEARAQILHGLSKEKQHLILEGCTYPENTVGRVIERHFVSFQESWTVRQSISYIRNKHIKQDFHAAIVIDTKHRPVGIILLSTLLKYEKDKLVKDIMTLEFKIADTLTDLSELSFIFKQYALTIVPVVNKSGKLVGTVSIANMIYIIEEQTEKDIMSLGGVYTQDIFFNLFYAAKHRFPWLFVNLITACITAFIISKYSMTISKLVTLAAVMPIVASMGGNAGTQAMTVTVRALANKNIHYSNILKVVVKEILVCGFNGLILACIGAILSLLMLSDPHLSVIFAVAILLNFLIAGFFGSAIPITLDYFDIDPAISSGVFLTTITDVFGFSTFLTLAYLFLV